MGLSEKELRFCREYAANPNGVLAYRKAFPGSTYKTALGNANKLLKKPIICDEVNAARKAHAKRCRLSAVKVIRELMGLAFSDPDDVFQDGPGGVPTLRPWGEISPEARRTIQNIEVVRKRLKGGGGPDDATEWEVENIKVRLYPKDHALDKLCKHLGITKDGAALEQLLKAITENESIITPKVEPTVPEVVPTGGESPPADRVAESDETTGQRGSDHHHDRPAVAGPDGLPV